MPTPDPAQFYSPIIQAMIHSANQQRELQQNQMLAEQHKQELALRQQEADRASKHLDFLEDQEKQKNASQAALQEAIRNNDLLNTRLNIGRAIREGILKAPTQAMQQMQPGAVGINQAGGTSSTSMNLPGVGDVDTSQFTTPEEAAQQEANRLRMTAQAQAEGTGAGQEPFKIAAEARKAQEDAQKRSDDYNKALDLQKARGGDEMNVENLRGHYQQVVANINGANRLKEIGLQQQLGAGDPQSAAAITDRNITDIINGQRAYSSLSKQEKAQVDSTATQRGWVIPTDQKAQNKNLDTITSLDTLLKQYQDIAQKYSRDSPTTNQDTGSQLTQKLSNKTSGLFAPTIPGSDLNAALENVSSTAGKLTKTFEDQARTNDANIVRQIRSVYDPHNTIQQNMANINAKRQLLNGTIQRTFAGMPPAQVTKILGDNGLTNLPVPGQKVSTIVRNPTTGQLEEQQ